VEFNRIFDLSNVLEHRFPFGSHTGTDQFAYRLCKSIRDKTPYSILGGDILFAVDSLFLGEVREIYSRFWLWDVALHTGSAIVFGLLGFLGNFMLFVGSQFQAPHRFSAIVITAREYGECQNWLLRINKSTTP